MPRSRARSTVPVFVVAFAVLALVIGLGLARLGTSDARAAGGGQGPVAAYSFDEGEGTTAEDETGNEHTATIEGASWTKGRYGSGLEFGSEGGDVVTIPDAEDLRFTEGEFTLEAWVRPREEHFWTPIIAKQTSEYFSYAFYVGGKEKGVPEGYISNQTWIEEGVAGTAALPLHAWSHVALTDDGARLRLYVNGALVDTGPASEVQTSEGDLLIGADVLGGEHGPEYFDGRIDEVRLYDRPLDAAEVGEDMATPIETSPAGPVADYAFDENEGTTAADASGNEHDATIEGATWAKGKYGSALHFDGEEGTLVRVPEDPAFDFEEEFTLEAWVRPDEANEWSAVVTKEREGGLSYQLHAEGAEEGPAGFVEGEDGIHAVNSPGAPLPAKAWSHLALTFDGAYLRLYVNGVLKCTEPASLAEASSSPVLIGGDIFEGADDAFKGRIDEVRLYDRALIPAEIGTDMLAPIQTPQQGPVAEYSFDEGEGTTVEDLTGNEHTATIEDGEWVRGKYGSAIGFDGKGGTQCLSIADAADLRLSEEFTLEAWVRPEGGVFDDPVIVKESEGDLAYGLGLGSREEHKAEGFIGEGGEAEYAIGETELRANAWEQIATTYDGAYLRVYVDGELAGSEYAPTAPATGSGAMKIGCDIPDGQFTGRIDEARIYNRALSEAEVRTDLAPIQTPQQGPVAAYSFDKGEGTTVEDLSGGSHTATIEGAKWTTHGRFGGALEFDASEEDVLKVPDSPDLDFTEEFTLEAWVRPSGADNHDAPLFAKQAEGGLGYFLYEGGTVSDRPAGAASEEQELIHAADPLDAHAWSHVALVFGGNRTFLYVNGALVDNGSAEPLEVSEGDLEIGGSSETGDYFDGRIDEVRIYNRALDPGEMAVNEESGLQSAERGPILAYSFDEGTGTTVEDLTGNGHTATIEGAEWTRGRFGKALKFSGDEDCLSIADAEDLQLNEEFTLEAWVKPEEHQSYGMVFFKETSGYFSYALGFGLFGGDRPEGAIDHGEFEPDAVATPVLPDENAWTHLALTFDGAHERIYVDGELEDITTSEGPKASEGQLSIGCSKAWEEGFTGKIDEVRVYDRSLTEPELRQTINASFPMAITEAATEVEANDAILNGTADANGGETDYSFEYGPTKAYGSTVVGEELGSNREEIDISEAIIDLAPETTYHYRLVADSPAGTAYGEDKTLSTGERVMTIGEEEELKGAEDSLSLIASESEAGPGSFYGMMWTGDLKKMQNQNIWEAIDRSGAKLVRFAIYPDPSLQSEIQEAFKEAAKRDITVLPYFGGGAFPKAGTANRANWIKYAKEMVKEYGPDSSYSHPVKAWEIWNEPNMPFAGDSEHEGNVNPEDFAAFFKEMSEAVRSASKGDIQILTPGLFGFRVGGCHPACHLKPRTFLSRMDKKLTELNYSNAYDAISLHPYVFKVGKPRHQHEPTDEGDAKQVAKAIERVVTGVHSLEHGKPIWVTELGFPVANPGEKAHVPPVKNPIQKLLVKATFAMLQNNHKRLDIAHAFYYNIQDDSKPGWEYHSGLLTVKGNQRPAWTSYSELAGGQPCPHAPC